MSSRCHRDRIRHIDQSAFLIRNRRRRTYKSDGHLHPPNSIGRVNRPCGYYSTNHLTRQLKLHQPVREADLHRLRSLRRQTLRCGCCDTCTALPLRFASGTDVRLVQCSIL
jgi:hypothetical protein